MKLNEWILFEKDICPGCQHPKLMLLIFNPETTNSKEPLRVVISCNCDSSVFKEDWQSAENMTIMVGNQSVLEAVAMMGDMMQKNQEEK